jgi:phospholipid/cholesterol/gamma-HCH transport system permease protein
MPLPPSTLLDSVRNQNTLVLSLRGDWDIREDPPGFGVLAPEFRNGNAPGKVTFDTAQLEMYDSSLISLLLQLHKRCEESKTEFDRAALPEGINQLLDMALAVPEKRDARAGTTERRFFHRVGEASIKLVDEIFDLVFFLGECLLSFGRFVTGRARFRRGDFWVTLQECGVEALPIVSLIGGLIGMIFAFVGAFQMAGFGATVYVAALVAIAMVREMGCLMTGVIMSGRTGAAFAAQLGSMKVNQEIDALKTFGFSPIDFLVLPRMLALILMMPLLTVYATLIGIAGGALVTCLGYDVGLEQYLNQTVKSLTWGSCALGLTKSVIFGVIVAAAGCLRGMQSGSSASAVGTAATSAVVVSITAIILTDCVFAVVTTLLHI